MKKYIVQGLYFGFPTKSKGSLYLMMYPYHWLVTPKTPYANKIRTGSIIQVPDKTGISPVYVIHRDSYKLTTKICKDLAHQGHPLKSVNSGKITTRLTRNSYCVLPDDQKTNKLPNKLNKLANAYSRLVKQHKVPQNVKPLDRMVYLQERHYKYSPCDRKYAWWLD